MASQSLRKMVLALGLIAMASGVVVAQQPEREAPPTAQVPRTEEGARQLISDMQQLQQRLVFIQEQALANDAELQEQAQKYQQTLLTAMRSDGFDPMQSLSHIESIEQQIQSQTLNEQERMGLMAEIQEEEQRLQAAEQAALENAQVLQAREQLMQGMLTAMREQEPRVDQMIEQLEEKNTQLRSMMTAEAPQLE